MLNQELKAEIVIEPVSKPDVDKDMAIDRHLASFGVRLSKADALSRYGRAEASEDDPGDALELQQPAATPQMPFNSLANEVKRPVSTPRQPPAALPTPQTALQTNENALQNARSDLGVQV